jgi:hypothetical protein
VRLGDCDDSAVVNALLVAAYAGSGDDVLHGGDFPGMGDQPFGDRGRDVLHGGSCRFVRRPRISGSRAS